MKAPMAARLKELEDDNRRMKKMPAEDYVTFCGPLYGYYLTI